MEYITANGTEYECQSVTTATDGIGFTIDGDVSEVADAFRTVTSLTVSGEDKEVYGMFDNLYFSYAKVDDSGTIEVFMSAKSNIELAIETLKATQAEQDEMIVSLMWG